MEGLQRTMSDLALELTKDRSHDGRIEEALAAHMSVCGRFNRVGSANPVLMQTEAMREAELMLMLMPRENDGSLGEARRRPGLGRRSWPGRRETWGKRDPARSGPNGADPSRGRF